MKIVILGQVPSLKNAKTIAVNRKTGARFVRTEDRVKQYMDSAKAQIKEQWQEGEVQLPVDITYVFYHKDKRRHDNDNCCATLGDCLKEFLGDDDQFHVREVVGRYAGVDKERPRAEVWID